MTRNTLFSLAAGSLVLFTIIGWWMMSYFGPVSLPVALRQGESWYFQLAMGVGLGAGLGLLAWLLISHSYFNNTREFFVNIIGPWKLNWTEVLMVSCCAGIGEEILFRGGIQPLLGIGWTSLLFVMLHGYITPFNRTLTIYGLFMVFAIMVIGWAAVKFGLIVAIVAHTMIDVILLNRLTRAYDPSLEDTSQE